MLLLVVGLVCVANRSWFEARVRKAIYGNRPEIHAGRLFRPGASAVEDGVFQTAVLIGGKPYVRVTSPTEAWRRHHKDAVCHKGTCTAAATPKNFLGSGGVTIGVVLACLLGGYAMWTLIVGDDPMPYRFPYRRYR
jgi:hypothetical protein